MLVVWPGGTSTAADAADRYRNAAGLGRPMVGLEITSMPNVNINHEILCNEDTTMSEPVLSFDRPENAPHFDGETYNPSRDRVRLGTQLIAVWTEMIQGRWMSLADLAHVTGYPEASISARLRDLRKPRFGAHTIERRRVADHSGTYHYRLVANPACLVEAA
jgi:hypothetical protein